MSVPRLLGAVLIGGAMAACSAAEPAEPPPPTTNDPTDPPTLTDSPSDQPVEAEVLAAYEGMWATYFEAGRPPAADPDVQQLREYAADEALDALISGLTSLRDQSLVFDGDVLLSPEVVDLTPASSPTDAQVEDCADSSDSARVRVDGEPFEDEPGGHRRIVADLELRGDQWKVVNFAVLGVGSCDG